ncbi:MAG: 6-carboxytetrahydropterin synthase [bacterium]
MIITKEFVFDAAHKLMREDWSDEQNADVFGKCFSLHGHTYRLQVSVKGPVDAGGMVINFTDLSQIVKEEIITYFDHKYLNELPDFLSRPPTCEHFALVIFGKLNPLISKEKIRLETVVLFETPTSWARLEREDYEQSIR